MAAASSESWEEEGLSPRAGVPGDVGGAAASPAALLLPTTGGLPCSCSSQASAITLASSGAVTLWD